MGRGIRIRAMVINVFWCLIDKLIKTGKDERKRGGMEGKQRQEGLVQDETIY